jgi:hypothetical protein
MITDRRQIARLRDLVIQGNTAQLADAAFVRELKAWIRFNPRQALETGDGLFSVASGNPSLPTWLGSAMFDATFKPKPENDRYAGQLDMSAGVAVFVGEREDRDHWTRVGRSSQRFALQATALGLKIAKRGPASPSRLLAACSSLTPVRALRWRSIAVPFNSGAWKRYC